MPLMYIYTYEHDHRVVINPPENSDEFAGNLVIYKFHFNSINLIVFATCLQNWISLKCGHGKFIENDLIKFFGVTLAFIQLGKRV